MAKDKSVKKEAKKPASKTPKEKKLEKQLKKAGKKQYQFLSRILKIYFEILIKKNFVL